ncbi:MAG: dolichol kinase [Ignavibacteria bacterium]|nr:dolichol kinase [Ignavibacteria bacterium]
MSQQISYTSELARKGIHLSSLMIPIVYLQLERWTGITILSVMTAVSLLIDVLMHYHAPTRRVMHALVGRMLRQHEVMTEAFRLTGASWVLIAATLTFLAFPPVLSTTAFTVLIVSDTVAALIGRRYGRRAFLDKTLVGTTCFFLAAVGVTVVYQHVFDCGFYFLVSGVVASALCAIVEASSIRLRVDDNISIPFSFALAMLGMNWIGHVYHIPSFLHL